MFEVSPKLVDRIKDINGRLQEAYSQTEHDRANTRERLEKSGAVLHRVERFSSEELLHWLNGKEIAAVDGSVNQSKGEAPHILYLFQALAKTTTGEACFTSDVYTPLIDEQEEEETSINWRAHILAKLELEAAYSLLEKRKLAILLMDGALYHYRIDAPEEWERLRQKALEEHTLLIGVSEEITTENLVKLQAFESYKKQPKTYDRDLLFGVLHQEETVYIEEIQKKSGLESVWMRMSTDPAIAGFDMLAEQASLKEEVARLLLSLTPKDGRGIPLWLDYVDLEVRVTDQLVDALLEQYIDPEIRKRFFERKRQARPF